ncbi:MAG TPA: hypothetical protein VM870_02855 [Pyrinomonadaceae bacterium]|nr:hypothetical protein [Pyrinomonadaceae bacterium]
MSKFTSPLDHVKVAAPCPANWDQMVGGERVRFCSQCNLNVYNLSGMTNREAESLLVNSEGRLCVRFYRRADGSILTKNCPVGLGALARKVSRAAGALFSALLSFGAGVGMYHTVWAEEGSEPEVISPEMSVGAIAVREGLPEALPPVVSEDPGYEMRQKASITGADQRPPLLGRIVVPVWQPPQSAKNQRR